MNDKIKEKDGMISLLKKSASNTISPSKKSPDEYQSLRESNQKLTGQLLEFQKQFNQLQNSNNQLQSKVQFLKQMRENAEKLQEEKMTLLHQLELMNSLRKENAELLQEIQSFKEKENEWTRFLAQNGQRYEFSDFY